MTEVEICRTCHRPIRRQLSGKLIMRKCPASTDFPLRIVACTPKPMRKRHNGHG